MRKFHLVLIGLLGIQPLFGQSFESLSKNSTNEIALTSSQDLFSLTENDLGLPVLDQRFNLMGYKPIKYSGYHVISSYQSNSNLDIIYFIDKNGNTSRRILAPTAPQNFDPNRLSNYDSMNPYGSPDVASALINALLGTIFDRGLGLR